jgi:MoaA/NifB/PqqE/SkfB family radical SAM enzyme
MSPTLSAMPVLILYPHRRCNCRCVMCDIWKDRSSDEISPDDLQLHLEDIRRLNVQWVVLSGGEPLMHSDLFRLTALIRSCGIRVTILTTGLLLEHHAGQIVDSVDDVIVSLDGPPAIHDQVRRVPGAFHRIGAGIAALHQLNPAFPVAARSTVQRLNYRYLRETARFAADMSSQAFNRTNTLSVLGQAKLALDEQQISELAIEFAGLLADWAGTDFLIENEVKLERILRHFRAHLGIVEPAAPLCNAPWVSAVLESDGTIRPCFFQDPIGKAGASSFLEVLNGPEAIRFRSQLNVSTDPICRRCVCSLNWKECA